MSALAPALLGIALMIVAGLHMAVRPAFYRGLGTAAPRSDRASRNIGFLISGIGLAALAFTLIKFVTE